eukprot:3093461-Pyramimonas_sp.AAC.1
MNELDNLTLAFCMGGQYPCDNNAVRGALEGDNKLHIDHILGGSARQIDGRYRNVGPAFTARKCHLSRATRNAPKVAWAPDVSKLGGQPIRLRLPRVVSDDDNPKNALVDLVDSPFEETVS